MSRAPPIAATSGSGSADVMCLDRSRRGTARNSIVLDHRNRLHSAPQRRRPLFPSFSSPCRFDLRRTAGGTPRILMRAGIGTGCSKPETSQARPPLGRVTLDIRVRHPVAIAGTGSRFRRFRRLHPRLCRQRQLSEKHAEAQSRRRRRWRMLALRQGERPKGATACRQSSSRSAIAAALRRDHSSLVRLISIRSSGKTRSRKAMTSSSDPCSQRS